MREGKASAMGVEKTKRIRMQRDEAARWCIITAMLTSASVAVMLWPDEGAAWTDYVLAVALKAAGMGLCCWVFRLARTWIEDGKMPVLGSVVNNVEE